jgi:hypothetical protein
LKRARQVSAGPLNKRNPCGTFIGDLIVEKKLKTALDPTPPIR